ncbi:hypothetical protein [Stackebrandtia nassauensis]|uniref:Uncharacterized protein n=1 Tax=Stackebrandtia nassauensis (strain DSM 44728 / CIP 108903 / NRRL B-16338 / NBRC 102104 / LLR-40K-21) TaxID=446470 RepID=D3Q8X8_STANL|nr:hypothetical protein [Stackebrandtia nassauensis]ADD40587.1 hypothetical protein Snas_0876 [Stackebrandtia nassauensis DSM 44728]
MGILADRLNTMTVRVTSPDDTVRLYLTGGDQLHLEFAKGSLDQHTETSLSKQLSHVCTAALRKRRQTMAATARKLIVDMDADEDDTFARRPRRPMARPAAANLAITAKGRSPRSLITIRRIPGDIFDVKIRKGSLGRFNGDQLTVEFHGALRATAADYQRQLAELREKQGGPS